MNQSGKTICLVMIVKNESKVIRRCFESVYPLLDYWCISDTGSTDGTQDIIRNYFKEKGIPGELHEDAWVNFGHNRSLAFKYAKGKADYHITLDADEVFKYDDGFKIPELVLDRYYLTTRYGPIEYERIQLVSDRFPWIYVGVLHEYIHCPQAKTIGLLPGIYNHPSPDGGRSSDPNKYKRDVLTLQRGRIDEPDNYRYVFYLAQSYRDDKDYENAIKYYRERTTLGGYDEEVYYSYYEIALCKARQGKEYEEFVGDFLRAAAYRPKRIEATYQICRIARMKGLFQLAYDYGMTAVNKPIPPDRLFVDRGIHRFKMRFEVGISAHFLGKHDETVEILTPLLTAPDTPEDIRHKAETIITYSQRGEKLPLGSINPGLVNNNNDPVATFTTLAQKKVPYSAEFVEFLKKYIADNAITSILDVGCGYYQELGFEGVYIGIDCVPAVHEYNVQFEADNRKFLREDALNSQLRVRGIQLCLIKNVLNYWDNNQIMTYLYNHLEEFEHILIVNEGGQIDDLPKMVMGQFRPLDVEMLPLSIFKPAVLQRFGTQYAAVIRGLRKADVANHKHGPIMISDPSQVSSDLGVEETKDLIGARSESTLDTSATVCWAVRAGGCAHVLPDYFDAMLAQTYDKQKMTVYIQYHKGDDGTRKIIEDWVQAHAAKYAKVVADFSGDGTRDSAYRFALASGCDYYYFTEGTQVLAPATLAILVNKKRPIVSPMLTRVPGSMHSNFYTKAQSGGAFDGYYQEDPEYYPIFNREKLGTFPVDVVRENYLVDLRSGAARSLGYTDDTSHYEFVVFSRKAREKMMQQFICNELEFGYYYMVKPEEYKDMRRDLAKISVIQTEADSKVGSQAEASQVEVDENRPFDIIGEAEYKQVQHNGREVMKVVHLGNPAGVEQEAGIGTDIEVSAGTLYKFRYVAWAESSVSVFPWIGTPDGATLFCDDRYALDETESAIEFTFVAPTVPNNLVIGILFDESGSAGDAFYLETMEISVGTKQPYQQEILEAQIVDEEAPICNFVLLSNEYERVYKVAQAKEQLVNYQIYDAIDYRKNDVREYAKRLGLTISPGTYHGRPFRFRDAQLACTLSHYTIWRDMADNDIREFVVLEDDVVLPDNFTERLQQIRAELPEDWRFVYLYFDPGYNELRAYGRQQSEYEMDDKELIRRAFPTWGTVGYMVRDAQWLIDAFQTLTITADNMLCELFIKNGTGAYCVKEQLVATDTASQNSAIWRTGNYK